MRDVFHIDANSAYLSWTAASMLEKGFPVDIRRIPAVISGNPENRHGIVLAKSIPAKKLGIKTGESLFEAKNKCNQIEVFPPDYEHYMRCSDAMYDLLHHYSPRIQRYSIDECFMDYTFSRRRLGPPLETAFKIKEQIKRELGFTVNIGLSCNKLLAKMSSELDKPDQVHTLYPEEIKKKMWPLPVSDLFMVGRATTLKLKKVNINTIGDLAHSNPHHLKALLKSHGILIWNYANGIDNSEVVLNDQILRKSIGNSITVKYDVENRTEAFKVLLALTEKVAMRLRRSKSLASLISISLKTSEFIRYSHQHKLGYFIDSTSRIYSHVCRLFDESWQGEPLRHLGVSVSRLAPRGEFQQLCFLDEQNVEKEQKIDESVDKIRKRYGEEAIMRGVFANSCYKPLEGGIFDGDYIIMGGYKT